MGIAKYEPVSSKRLHALAIDTLLSDVIQNHWALYPDHVVFLGPEAAIFSSSRHSQSSVDERNLPPFIFLKGQGVFQSRKASKAQLAQLECYFDVVTRIDNWEFVRTLSMKDVEDLINWDAPQKNIETENIH